MVAAVVTVLSFPVVAGVGMGAAIVILGGIAQTDDASHRIPNRLIVAAELALLATAAVRGQAAFASTAVVAAVWFLAFLGFHLADPRLGFGDVKLAGVLGSLLGLACSCPGWGIAHAALVSAAAFVAGGTLTLAKAARLGRDSPVPFAPGLVFAVVAVTVTIGLAT